MPADFACRGFCAVSDLASGPPYAGPVMNAIPTDLHPPAPAAGKVRQALSMRWAALHDAADAVAALAGIAPERPTSAVRNFPALVRDLDGSKLELVRSGIDDLAAIMQPGLAALLAVNARGQSAAVAAHTLWHEFLAARDALVRLAPVSAAQAPRRPA